MRRYSIVIIAAFATPAEAQPPPVAAAPAPDFEAIFNLYKLTTRTARVRQIEEVGQAFRRARLDSISVSSPAIGTASANTAIDLAQAAISTSVKGSEAGATINPLALAGKLDGTWATPLTVATLKDNITRFQAGVVYQKQPSLVKLMPECQFDEAKFERESNKIRLPFKNVCTSVLPVAYAGTNDAEDAEFRADLLRQCGGLPGSPETLSTATTKIRALIEKLLKKHSGDIAVRDTLQRALDLTEPFKTYDEPRVGNCLNGDALRDAIVRNIWRTRRLRFAISARIDAFNRVFGFNPNEEKDLSDGRISDKETRLEVSYGRRFFEASVGVGVGVGRASFDDGKVAYLGPAASVALTIARLSAERLLKNGDVNLVDGSLPPRLVLGAEASFSIAFETPPLYATRWQKVSIAAFLDFRFSDTLSVRLGAPLAGIVVKRAKDEMKGINELHDMQWSVPVFVATVLKL